MSDPDPRLIKWMNRFAPASAVFAVLVGLSALAGWKLHIAQLGTWGVPPVRAVANAAIAFVLLGIASRLKKEVSERTTKLAASEKRVAGIIHSAMDAILTTDEDQTILLFNVAAEKIFGCAAAEALGQPITRFIPERFRAAHAGHLHRFGLTGVTNRTLGGKNTVLAMRANGEEFQTEASISQVEVEGKKLFTVILRDVTERNRAEEALQQSEHRYRTLFNEMVVGFALLEMLCDENGLPCDHRYLEANSAFETQSGLPRDKVLGKTIREVFPGLDPFWIETYGKVAITGESVHFENYVAPLDRWLEVTAFRARQGQVGVTFADITARKRAEQQLAEKAQELARSNADLEQFAYVASHDLQEPLRMVTAYTQLLGERYRGQLDDNADKFIGYASEGALRMEALIRDLLAFSRVGRKDAACARVDCEVPMAEVLQNLGSAIRESRATVTHSALPVVWADRSQMTQLFQNLIANAIKFRGNEPPRISLQAEKTGDHWLFSVADNGIGIAREHAENIFVVFQRLHSRAEYPGNGIGLAICKKIVERYGGKIWVEAGPGRGSVFKFTLPLEAGAEKSCAASAV